MPILKNNFAPTRARTKRQAMHTQIEVNLLKAAGEAHRNRNRVTMVMFSWSLQGCTFKGTEQPTVKILSVSMKNMLLVSLSMRWVRSRYETEVNLREPPKR